MDSPPQSQMLPSSCFGGFATSFLTPPDTPIKLCTSACDSSTVHNTSTTCASLLSTPDTSTPPEPLTSPTLCSSIVTGGNVVYQAGEIRSMAATLSHARDKGEFPTTTTSTTDSHAVVTDYGNLLQLRQLRGDLSAPVPEAYTRFLVEIVRRIKERDATDDEIATEAEAARRIESYLRSVEQEQRYFNATKATLKGRETKNPIHLDLRNVGEEIYSIIENAAEQTIADAASPLRMNIGNLHSETVELRNQNDTLGRQIAMHYGVLKQQHYTNNVLRSNVNDQLVLASGLVKSLLHIIANPPTAHDCVVSSAQQTQWTYQGILEEQKKVLHNLELQSEYLQHITSQVELSRYKFSGPSNDISSVPYTRTKWRGPTARKPKGRMRRMMSKVFRSKLKLANKEK